MDVEIDEVVTELIISEPNGSLSRAEMRQIVQTVMEHLNAEQQRTRQKQNDTGIRDRAYQPESGNV